MHTHISKILTRVFYIRDINHLLGLVQPLIKTNGYDYSKGEHEARLFIVPGQRSAYYIAY